MAKLPPKEFLDELNNEEERKKLDKEKADQIHATNKAGIKTVEAVNKLSAGLKDVKGEVTVSNPDLAKSDDLQKVVDSVNKMNMTAFITNDGLPKLAENLATLSDKVKALSDNYENEGLSELSSQLSKVVDKLDVVSKKLSDTKIKVDVPLQKTIDGLQKSISAIDFSPQVTVNAPDTKVVTTPVNLEPVTKALSAVLKAVKDNKPDNEATDLEPVIKGLDSVQNAITSLRFPVPNFLLPFKDVNGKDAQVQLDASGNIPTTGGGGGGSGTQYAELVTTAPATGTVALGRYKASPPVLTDGQMYGLQLDTSGNLKVTGSLSVGGTTDNSAFTAGSSTGTPTMGFYHSTIDAVTDGRSAAVAITANRASHANLRNASGTEIGISGTPLRVDPTGTTTQPVSNGGTFAVQATLAAETTKVIGTVNQGTSPWVVSGTVTSAPASSLVSTANSTTANLGIGATFTGTSEDVSNYSALQVSVFSSHASATDGLSMQQSSDGTNWDIIDTYTIPATTGKVFSIQPAAKFFRLVYTNGATLTTSLRIQSVYHYQAPNPSSQRSSDAYTNETDLTQLWSFNSLYNGTTWDRMRGDITNGLDVDVTRLPALATGANTIGAVNIAAAQTLATVTTLTGTTSLTPGTAAANLGKAEDAVHASGDTGVLSLAVRNDNSQTTATSANGDYSQQSVDATGAIFQRPVPSTAATTANVAGSVTSVTALASNAARKTAIFYNDSASDCYVKYGASATTSSFTYFLPSLGTLSFTGDEYSGLVAVIWNTAVGNLRVTETSA